MWGWKLTSYEVAAFLYSVTMCQSLESELSQCGYGSVWLYQIVANQLESRCLWSFPPEASVLFSQGIPLHSFTDMDVACCFLGDRYCSLMFYLKWWILMLWFFINSGCHWQATTDTSNHKTYWQQSSENLCFLFGFTETCVITLQIIISVFSRDESSL